MLEVGPRLFQRGDCEPARHRAAAEAFDLREDKPHPVAGLVSLAQFGQDPAVDRILGLDEAAEVEGVAFTHSATISLIRPTIPLSSMTLMPCGWSGDLVNIRWTTPSVSLPVRWFCFSTTRTRSPGRMFARVLPSTAAYFFGVIFMTARFSESEA